MNQLAERLGLGYRYMEVNPGVSYIWIHNPYEFNPWSYRCNTVLNMLYWRDQCLI